ncbi:MAG: putative addiction module antidote protein [Alphaproteobacteria bacterium]|nr:putative addiction module antidote protein [Alphaproteobacteria bacterium]
MPERLSRFDAADYLDTPETIAAYLDDAAASGDAGLIARALGAVARAQNMSALARKTGISRPGLHKALSGEGNPSLDTLVKVAKALGLTLGFSAGAKTRAAPKRAKPARASSRKAA